jgi:hypothetical protein
MRIWQDKTPSNRGLQHRIVMTHIGDLIGECAEEKEIQNTR